MENQFQQANLFELSGDYIQVTYSSSSFTGAPLLSYRDPSTNAQFSGRDIRSESTEIGDLLTVALEQIPDLRTVTFTLLLPIWKRSACLRKYLINKKGASHFVNRSSPKKPWFGYRITTAIMMLLILQLDGSLAFADSVLLQGLTNTARSGFSGTTITAVGAASDYHAINMVTTGEESNAPCYLAVSKADINNAPGNTISDVWIDCTPNASQIQSAGWFTNNVLYVYGIQACTNNYANHRVKGIRVYGGPIQNGVIQQIGLFDELTRPHCRTWHSAVFCPQGQVATKVRVHHTGDEINGLSLACRVVADQ